MPLKFQKLTRTNIRSLQANKKICEHGIAFERLANGDGRYSINIMVDGKRIHRVLGKESEGVTRNQAEEFIEKVRTDSREGRLNLPKGRKLSFTFKQAAEKYLVKLEKENGKDIKKKRERLDLHILKFFSNKSLANLTTHEVEKYKKMRMDAGAKNSTINRELAIISHLLNKAVEWQWIDYNPCQVKRMPEDSGRITYLTTEQINNLLEAAKVDQCIHIYPFIVVGLETSMRRMEILSVRLEHIDVKRRVIYVPEAKAGAREQPITQNLANFLLGHIESSEAGQKFLFPSKTSAPGHVVSIEKPFRRVVERAGMDPKEVVRHTLRHTAITHLVQAGIDLPTVQRISGHKTMQMVVRYSHQNGEHIQSAMDKLEKRYNINS